MPFYFIKLYWSDSQLFIYSSELEIYIDMSVFIFQPKLEKSVVKKTNIIFHLAYRLNKKGAEQR